MRCEAHQSYELWNERRSEADRDGRSGREMKKDFFTRSDPNWRSDGACNDDLAGFQRLAEHGKKICNVTDVVDELASEGLQGLRVVEAVDLGAVAKDAAGEALKIAADAPGVVRTENDMALIDVASERTFHVVGGM